MSTSWTQEFTSFTSIYFWRPNSFSQSCWTFQLRAPSASQLSIFLAQSRYHSQVPLEKSSRHISNANELVKCGQKWLQRTFGSWDIWCAQVHCTSKSSKKVCCWILVKAKRNRKKTTRCVLPEPRVTFIDLAWYLPETSPASVRWRRSHPRCWRWTGRRQLTRNPPAHSTRGHWVVTYHPPQWCHWWRW